MKHFKKILLNSPSNHQSIKKHWTTNQIFSCTCIKELYLIALIIVTLFAFGGCSSFKQSATKDPLTETAVEKALVKYNSNWKPYDLKISDEEKAKLNTSNYGFDDGDGLKLIVSTYKKLGATYLNISPLPQRYVSGEEPPFIQENLPDLFKVACELYGNDIDPKEFDEFWDLYKSYQGLSWRKVVGDDILYVHLHKDENLNITKVTSVIIQNKSWTDWSSLGAIKTILWENKDASIKEHLSTVGDIIENKAVAIKSSYIINGNIVDSKKLTDKATLPDEKEILSKLYLSYSISETAEYNVLTIEDTTGKIEVIIPASQISESEYKELKYFLVYEYATDQGRSFILLAMTRTLEEPPK